MLPTVTVAAAAFAAFFPIAGALFFGLLEVPAFELRSWHLLAGVRIGLLGAAVAVVVGGFLQGAIRILAGPLERHRLLVPTLAGGFAGALIFVMPLAGFSGAEESGIVISEREELAPGLLIGAVGAKLLATSVVFGAGFVGGPIFPMLFIGGTAGTVLSQLVPGLPPGVVIPAMMVAVPAPLLGLPISAVFLVSFAFGIGAEEAVPAGIATLTSLVVFRVVAETLSARRAAA